MNHAIDLLVPRAGYYRLRAGKGAPWSAVRVWDAAERDEEGRLIEDERWCCTIDGNPRALFEPLRKPKLPYDGKAPVFPPLVETINVWGEPIDEAEYNYLLADRAFQRDSLGLTEGKAADLRKMPPVLPPTPPAICGVDTSNGPDRTVRVEGIAHPDGTLEILGNYILDSLAIFD